jgi:DNA-binding SARP family transcriptional activator/pimeloyl-ACP methyl ester carboxylesterase
MEFRILGPMEVIADGRTIDVGAARTRTVLALLLVHRGRVVPADRLTNELWPDRPAARAAASLQVRLSELRKALRCAGQADRLVTTPPGYLLKVEPAELDAARFEALAGEGAGALAAGRSDEALRQLDQALGLWRGSALAGIDGAPLARNEAARLEEARLNAIQARMQAALDCGMASELIAELESLTAAYPLRERLWSHRLLALYRAGRQADALHAYRELRDLLVADLAIEPGNDLRELHARILRQDPALDGQAERPGRRNGDGGAFAKPRTSYALTDDGVHIAYQVLGTGDQDIVFVPGVMSHLDLLWEDPETASFYQRLSTLGRLILFDKRDTGLSDRGSSDASLQERTADLLAVMHAAGSARACLFGYSEGASLSILLAATHRERVSSLILGSASARWPPAPGYPCGQGFEQMYDDMVKIATTGWGRGDSMDWYLPSRSGSPHVRELFGRFERMAVSPSSFLRMLRMIRAIDVRSFLPAIDVPTLIIQRLADRITPPSHGRYLAAHIAGARYFEQPGDHSLRFESSGDSDALCAVIADFLGGVHERRPADADDWPLFAVTDV